MAAKPMPSQLLPIWRGPDRPSVACSHFPSRRADQSVSVARFHGASSRTTPHTEPNAMISSARLVSPSSMRVTCSLGGQLPSDGAQEGVEGVLSPARSGLAAIPQPLNLVERLAVLASDLWNGLRPRVEQG